MTGKKWGKLLFAAYCLVMLWLLFGQRIGQTGSGSYVEQLEKHLLYRPLETIRRFLWVLRYSTNAYHIRHAVVNLVGNVVMFVPLGFFVPRFWKKLQKFGWHFLAMMLTIVAIELLQMFTLLGKCDVDDLLLNLVGTTMGFGLWKLWKHFSQKK